MNMPDAAEMRRKIDEYKLTRGIPLDKFPIPDKQLSFEYERISGKSGDAVDFRLTYGRAVETEKFFSEHPEYWPVLDLGCGEGYFLEQFENRGVPYAGAELSILGYALAKHGRSEGKGVMKFSDANRNVFLTDCYNLPFENEQFGGVLYSGVLMMLPWTEFIINGRKTGKEEKLELCSRSLREANRIMKPNGFMRLVTSSNVSLDTGQYRSRDESYIDLTEQELRSLVESAGFDLTCLKPTGRSRFWNAELIKPKSL